MVCRWKAPRAWVVVTKQALSAKEIIPQRHRAEQSKLLFWALVNGEGEDPEHGAQDLVSLVAQAQSGFKLSFGWLGYFVCWFWVLVLM